MSKHSNQQLFAQIQNPQIERSTFDRSHGVKLTCDAGKLIPILLDELLPGDTINIQSNLFARMATLIKPIMDNIYVDVHYFAVPNRLLWDNWQKFNGETGPVNIAPPTNNYVIPTVTAPGEGYAEDSIFDYFGLPTKAGLLEHSALFNRAYNLIYSEWYRDENLQDYPVLNTDDGPDNYTDYPVFERGKRKDYFTSCLPWAQKSAPVSIPLGTSVPVS